MRGRLDRVQPPSAGSTAGPLSKDLQRGRRSPAMVRGEHGQHWERQRQAPGWPCAWHFLRSCQEARVSSGGGESEVEIGRVDGSGHVRKWKT